ncbi:MAG: hypothetical protein GF307_02920 [candidate division Zixibacteria bacterium]|nr:hypothetical protein [candidate division Zixibacteria bacterium]
MYKALTVLLLLTLVLTLGCGGAKEETKTFTGMPDLILAQAQFHNETGDDGEEKPVPGAARLMLVYKTPSGWDYEVLEDEQSNVFHKGVPFVRNGQTGILTLGANKAILKFWTRQEGKWTAEVLYQGSYGGENDRLRDIEIGDVNGDGKDNIVLATHDQGIVLVLDEKDGKWETTEIDKHKDTFVHEIELGDVDNDGIFEIFSTPSEPNKLDGTVQPGLIPMYDYKNGEYVRSIVEEFPTRHVKEILCADIDSDNQPELYCALEAEMEEVAKGGGSVQIKKYDFDDGKINDQVIMELPDMLCRFLTVGDVDGDGNKEMVVAPLSSGVWLFRYDKGKWTKELIDKNSSSFEHATVISDLNGDSKNEIYIAADDQGFLNKYEWNGSEFVKETLVPIEGDILTFGVIPGKMETYKITEELRIG